MNKVKVKFIKMLKAMSYSQFLMFCGRFYSPTEQKYISWTPWPKQKSCLDFFDVYKILWFLKARQVGMSEIAALYAVKVALCEPKSEIIVISIKLPAAKYFLKKRIQEKLLGAYELQMEQGKKFPWPKYQALEGRILFDNGSWIEAVSSDNEEVRSRTPRLVIFDEIRTFSNNDANELWSGIIPSIEDNPRAQAICISTAKHGTWFNQISQKIISGELGGIKYYFLPANARPTRTAEWYVREEKKWPDKKLFYREYPRSENDCFAAREGAIWPQFDPIPGGKHVTHIKIDFGLKYVIAYDHGRQHPAVMLFMLYDRYSDHLLVFDEVYCRGIELPEVCFIIRERMNFYKKNHFAPDPQLKIADSACFAKDGRRPVADTLRNILGVSFKKSIKHDRDGSIDLVSVRLSYGKLTIDPRCENLIKQTSGWIWKSDPTEKKKEIPVDIEDDGPDLLRYVCSELKGTPYKIPKKEDLHFNRKFNEHKKELSRKYKDFVSSPGAGDGMFVYTDSEINAWEGL